MPSCWSVGPIHIVSLISLLYRSTRFLSRIIHEQLICRVGLHVLLSIEINCRHPRQKRISEGSVAISSVFHFCPSWGFVHLVRHLRHALSPSLNTVLFRLASFVFLGFSSILDQTCIDISTHTRRRTTHELPCLFQVTIILLPSQEENHRHWYLLLSHHRMLRI